MELINATRMVAAYTMGMEPSGRELLVVVVKGTFSIPKTSDEPARLAEEQLPLIMADTFTGEPGFSAPVYEVDFAPRKHRCDVLLLGSAYAPKGRPATRVPVGIRIGDWTKSFAVVGNRRWDARVTGIRATPPEPFVNQPISYDVAFGGVDAKHENPAKHSAFMRNPVGRGYHKQLKKEWIDGAPLPNTEELNSPVTQPDGNYLPMSLGPVGRNWEPRLRYAGTYDKKWLDDVFPFLPSDFDERYYQAAPPDQHLSSDVRGQDVVLMNLTPDERRTFRLPAEEMPVHIFPKRGEREDMQARIDTISIEPDCQRFSLTWRATRPLRKNMLEIHQILVGRRSKAWWRARNSGKTYYPSLAQLVHERQTRPTVS